ncbi:Hypothetical predicted protein [Cloeon dipterum]|uniref:Translation initiation factor beta propellor-like domain-containing protein n=1 Tax=Cloeon dipterum TaxID=197152 RepID=A0A8S1CT25_9INSE|nr:Hypothetical predicted protein [Cloeon dipterum]
MVAQSIDVRQFVNHACFQSLINKMMQFSQPPPSAPNMSVPPPHVPTPFGSRIFGSGGGEKSKFYTPFRNFNKGGGMDSEFDGKRLRKSVMRKTVDYNSCVVRMLENRVWQRDWRDRAALQPDQLFLPEMLPPAAYPDNASNAITTRFVKSATNKMRCPVFCLAWTPEGRRLVTGASSGEFTLWNGLTFNFETILQAHDSPVRTMVWSHNDIWMVTGDHGGYVKYWQSNMNNVKMFQAHKEALRGISFSPTDQKFATCSDDGTIRIWDFLRCQEERILRGHGADVKCIHWHPHKGLIISGSKDNQQPVKLWDPKSGQSLATLHAHKSTVMDVRWNDNGNWLVTASRDHLLKLFDLRNLSQEVQTFRGHKKEASAVAWHPVHEGLFCSGGSDGSLLFWNVGADKEIGAIEQAHDSIVWSLAWHPLGHILVSGSNDHTSKFWTRNRPGDQMRDKYNLNTLPAGMSGYDDNEIDDMALIPGMGPDDKVDVPSGTTFTPSSSLDPADIPGLDFDSVHDMHKPLKKVPYAKPIPKNFQAQWNETKNEDEEGRPRRGLTEEQVVEVISKFIEQNPPPGFVPLKEIEPEAIILFGQLINIVSESPLAQAIKGGSDAVMQFLESGGMPELSDEIHSYRIAATKSDDDDNNLELRPDEHESYQGDEQGPEMDDFEEDNDNEEWSEYDEKESSDNPFQRASSFGSQDNFNAPNNPFDGPNFGGMPPRFPPRMDFQQGNFRPDFPPRPFGPREGFGGPRGPFSGPPPGPFNSNFGRGGNFGGPPDNFNRPPGPFGPNQGNFRPMGNFGNNQGGNFGNNQGGNFGNNQGSNFGNNQGSNFGNNQGGNFGNNHGGNFGGNQGNFGGRNQQGNFGNFGNYNQGGNNFGNNQFRDDPRSGSRNQFGSRGGGGGSGGPDRNRDRQGDSGGRGGWRGGPHRGRGGWRGGPPRN